MSLTKLDFVHFFYFFAQNIQSKNTELRFISLKKKQYLLKIDHLERERKREKFYTESIKNK